MHGDDMTSIYSRLDRLDGKLDQIMEAVTQQVTICGPSRAKLDAVCNTVYGNGRDGLVTRIDRLETIRRVAWHMAAATVGLLSAIVGSLITWLLARA
jgi:hypothetical protein